MMDSVFMNGRVLQASGEFESLNLLVQDNVLVGKGYLPDESEDTLCMIDALDCYIVPSVLAVAPTESLDDATVDQWQRAGIAGVLGEGSMTVKEGMRAYAWVPLDRIATYQTNHDSAPSMVGVMIQMDRHRPDDVKPHLVGLQSLAIPLFLRWGSVFNPDQFLALLSVLAGYPGPIIIEAVDSASLLTTVLAAKRHYPSLTISASLEAFFGPDAHYFFEALDAQVIDVLYATVNPSDTILLALMIARLSKQTDGDLLALVSWQLRTAFQIKPPGFCLGKPPQFLVIDPTCFVSTIKQQQKQGELGEKQQVAGWVRHVCDGS